MLSPQLRIRLNEIVQRLCVDLEIPYDPHLGGKWKDEDKRPYVLAAALDEMATAAQDELKRESARARGQAYGQKARKP